MWRLTFVMRDVKLIIFDLDGTVNDSSPGIIYCFQKTGELYDVYDIPPEKMSAALCGPFEVNIAKVLDLKPDQVDEAIQKYVKFYLDKGAKMSRLFPGVKEAITDLKSKGYLIGLATMMVEEYAKDTLRNSGILDLFDTVHGTNFTTPYAKEDLIDFCLMELGLSPEEAVLIGDGIDDHRAAKISHVGFIAAKYGYEIKDEYCDNTGIKGIWSAKELSDMF